ncbi:hypothetical protein BC829DRAFT_405647 [Chytridium lagenaria]|nr:hypothetical protein BC829DRAFT_405647 [Chytridium lagenaria]
MVVIKVKKSDELLFTYETMTTTSTTDLINKLCAIYNERLRLRRLIGAVSDILQYGLWKEEKDHGYSMEEIELFTYMEEDPSKGKIIEKDGTNYILNRDPTGRRTGECPNVEASLKIRNAMEKAESLLKETTTMETSLNLEDITAKIISIGEALIAAYPIGLPDWEPAKDIIENCEDLKGTAASKEVIEKSEAALWLASKEIVPGKLLSDFVGRNEKTRVIMKLMKNKNGPPCQEPAIPESMRKDLLSYFSSKEKELEKLSAQEDDFENSVWAKPNARKPVDMLRWTKK